MEHIKEYLDYSSFHGFLYFTQPGRHWVERVFWLVCVCGSWYLCIQLILTSYNGYLNNALSFGTETDYLHWNASLFSVAVCESKNKPAVYAYGEKLWGKNHDNNLDEILNEIVYFKGDHYFIKNFCSTSDKANRRALPCPQSGFKNLSDMVRGACHSVLQRCTWMEKDFDCCQYFQPMDTERGLCFTINSVQVNNPKSFPLINNKITGVGSLRLEIKVPAEVYAMAPEETAFINAPSDEIVHAQIGLKKKRVFKIIEIQNGPVVRSKSIEQRKCIFPDEIDLKIFKRYSYMACVVNCRKEKQMELCGCVSHLIPKTDPTKHCNITGLICLIDHYSNYSILINSWSTSYGLHCDCLPSCYEPEFDLVESLDTGSGEDFAIVEYALHSLPSLRFKRTVTRDTLDLVVSMGGSVGLFLGASLLSFVEIIYFCFLRPYGSRQIKKRARENLKKVMSLKMKEKRLQVIPETTMMYMPTYKTSYNEWVS